MAASVAFIAACILSACNTSPEIRQYYTLDMTPSVDYAGPAVEVGNISVADALAKRNLMIAVKPTQVEYYALHEWAGGLHDLVRMKLARELGAENGRSQIRIDGRLLHFEQVEHANPPVAHVALQIDVQEAGLSTPAAGLYEARVPLEQATPLGLSVGLSKGLEQIAADLARDLEQADGA
jgi:uncharacterized lipoprotein YmbA